MTTYSNSADVFTIDSWITELLTWADWMTGLLTWSDNSNYYYRSHLPRNRGDFDSKIEYYLKNKRLITVPKNTVYFPISLNKLKDIVVLQVTSDDNAISESLLELECDIELQIYSQKKTLPESLLAQLAAITSLTGLTIDNDCLTKLPDDLEKFNNLNKLIVPPHLFSQLPQSFINKYRNDVMYLCGHPLCTLYRPSAADYSISTFGFFLIEDDWDEQSFFNLKHKSAADFLFALQTTDKCIDKLYAIDGIIVCKADEIRKVMRFIENIISTSNLSGMDINDIVRMLQFDKPAHFIESYDLGIDALDQVEAAVIQLIDQIDPDIIIKNMIITFKSKNPMSMDKLMIITDAIEKRVNEDEENYPPKLCYNSETIDKPDCCWIEVIYMVE